MTGCPIHGPGSNSLWVQKGLPCLWAELMSFLRRDATKLDLVFGKQKSRKPFAVEKQENRFRPLGFHLPVKWG